MASVLVIGGTGLISGAIATQLRERGDDVTIVTRGRVAAPDGVRIVNADRSDRDQLGAAFDRSYDAVIDAICYEPADALAVTELAAGKVAQFIFTSTVDTYPKPAPRYPVDESFPRGASSDFPYASKKVRCEEIVEAAANRGDFAATILRPGATYGDTSTPIAPPLPFRLMGLFLQRLQRGEPVILPGDGTSLWTSCHRDDVASAFVGAVANPLSFGRAYNVTGFEALTWNAYWRTVARVIDAPPPSFVYIPTDALARLAPDWAEWCVVNFAHPGHYDSMAAARDLGFRPVVSWEQGVRRMQLEKRPPFSDRSAVEHFDQLVSAWLAGVDAAVLRAGRSLP